MNEEMDTFANEAAKEIKKTWTTEQLLRWIEKWKMKAGYKRLIKKANSVFLK
jgi:hypothetical protein